MSATSCLVILTTLDGFADSRLHLVDRRTRIEFHWFVGICVTPQVFSELTVGERIMEVPDSYSDEDDESDKI